jgi:acyl-CoA synthetase (NDP forming)/RimJ/RimL family protein N-acetyltransferase
MSFVPAPQDAPDRAVDVALRDGSTLRVRPVAPGDAPAMRTFFEALSQESLVLRFFGSPSVDWITKWAVEVDQADRYALVATSGPEQAIVGHGAYIRVDGERAEVAFVVADRWQGQGIATIMLGQLAAAAQEHGISVFTAEVLPRNHRMIDVFRGSGFPVELHSRGDVIGVEFPTSLSAEALVRFEARERTAAVAALRSFLRPSAVAVIGASRRRGTVGGELLHNLLSAGFSGAVYPVNLRAASVGGVAAHASIGDVPGRVELALLAVPAEAVTGVARECGAAGVRALVVLTAGFADSGPDGRRRQRELLAICRETGMRLVGPDSLGVLNAAPDVRLHATFAGPMPASGSVGFLSQSGALGIALLELAGRRDLGLSSFVSVGNKSDISGNDLLQYWEEDPDTAVVLLYLESFGNPRRFARIARRVGRAKPIVAVKGGRSAAGAHTASSNTAALLSSSDVTVDALFDQAGVIRADTIAELFDVAALLSAQPVPSGRRVVIVSNAGGPATLCADACRTDGLDVVELPAAVRARLRRLLPADASLANPIDMLATARAEDYRATIEALAKAHACDAVLTIFVPPLLSAGPDVVRQIHAAAAGAPHLTIASVFMGSEVAAAPDSGALRVPSFGFPEEAVRALAHAMRYGAWRRRPLGTVFEPADARPDEAAAVIAAALGAGEQWLGPDAVAALLACYGLPLVPSHVVRAAGEAAQAAAAIGGPVALKALVGGLVHRSDVGAVRLQLRSAAEVRRAVPEMRAALEASGHRVDGFIVQPMADPGVELLVGVAHDTSFGPVIVCGPGGASAELMHDAAARITPLTDTDAREMLQSLRTYPLLSGYRGSTPCDLDAIHDVLLRLSALVEAHSEVAELDLDPLVASAAGALVVDARVRLEAAPPLAPLSALRA